MNELCKCGSGEKIKSGCETFGFSYKDFNLTVVKIGSECKDCALNKRRVIEAIDEYGERLIKKSLSGIEINWDFYCKFMEDNRKDNQSLNDILVALGRFSVDPKDGWIITDGLIFLNPSWYIGQLYFRDKMDVLAYAKLKFANFPHWKIMQISVVIKRSDIIK